MQLFSSLPLLLNVLVFVALTGAVWIAGSRLSHLADAIGERTRVGGALMGLLFLAGITELPELVTTLTASLKGDAALALNNMFGGIVMQTAILAVADAAVFHATLTTLPRRPTPILEGVLLILLLTFLLGIVSVGEMPLIGGVGLGVLLLAGLYAVSILVLRAYDRRAVWTPVLPSGPGDAPARRRHGGSFAGLPLHRLLPYSAAAAAVILVCGVLLVESAGAIAVQSGLGSSFIGVTLLAASTSLPELSTTIAAMRMGAYTMAISNIFGSNLIMVVVILPAELSYREGQILGEADDVAQLALLAGIFVTAIYVAGLLLRKKWRILGMGADSILVLGVYLAT
ncbi:MAG: sodium:calcium antiporter, partial [Pseudomonadota bacterium]